MSRKIDKQIKTLVTDLKDATEELVEEYMDDGEDYVLVDPDQVDRLSAMTQAVFGDITKQSAAKQVAIGGVSGYVSGYLVNRVGKTAAIVVGTSVLLVQVAQYNGYIQVDWTKVKRSMNRARAEAEKRFRENKHSYIENVKRFYRENYFLASGFAGGFLMGFLF